MESKYLPSESLIDGECLAITPRRDANSTAKRCCARGCRRRLRSSFIRRLRFRENPIYMACRRQNNNSVASLRGNESRPRCFSSGYSRRSAGASACNLRSIASGSRGHYVIENYFTRNRESRGKRVVGPEAKGASTESNRSLATDPASPELAFQRPPRSWNSALADPLLRI